MDKAKSELSDQELLIRCRNNDLKAYEMLFYRYSKRLHNYGIKYLGNAEVAEEKMMDVMVWVWKNRSSLPEDVNFEPYIFRAMKNALAMEIRKRILHTLSIHELDDNKIADGLRADAPLACKELTNSYHDKLHSLSSQRRKTYLLSREEGLSNSLIAKELDISVNTVKNHLKASLSHLRSHLDEYNNIVNFLILSSSLIFC
ncbi:MAG: sigma-70 family RNA polymerase sigma factor [Chitinophagaceae bacterium]|nr:sigma-70 family RNA polymerase sigma factor [Chitinophagaceae bacterium]